MSFVQRKIDVTFARQTGAIGQTGFGTVKVSGLRVAVSITMEGGLNIGTATVRIYGMQQQLMQALATYGAQPGTIPKTALQIQAGDEESGMFVIYTGDLIDAWTDFNNAPDVCFVAQARPGAYNAVKAIAPASYPTTVNAYAVAESLARHMGYAFENGGVNVIISNPYLPGTGMQQLSSLAEAANFEYVIENNTLAIWPRDGHRAGDPIPIGPGTGLVGYPLYGLRSVIVKMLLNPSIRFGSLIQVQSSQKPACGIWRVTRMEYSLASETPGGDWFLTVEAAATSRAQTTTALPAYDYAPGAPSS